VAKKTRTPAPPRKVQAPQQRKDPRRARSLPGGKWVALLVVVALAAIAAAIVAVVVARGGGNNNSSSSGAQPASLIGLQTGPSPRRSWPWWSPAAAATAPPRAARSRPI
jgi:negative regulator of sigma E activity